MIMPDAGLRKLFRDHVKEASWTPIETGMTMAGVPDAEYIFPGGTSGWVEFKATRTSRIKRSKSIPFQVAWHEKRARMGGRTFVAVRHMGEGCDVLFIYRGHRFREIVGNGLWGTPSLGAWYGGPKKWDWKEVVRILKT